MDATNQPVNLPQLLNCTETRKALGNISRVTLWRLTKSGAIKVTRIGGTVRWSTEAIAEYLAAVTFPRRAA